MKFYRPLAAKSVVSKPVIGVVVACTALSLVWGGTASAEPAQDNSVNLNELHRKSEELSATMLAAKQDFDQKMQLVSEADQKSANDLMALDAANTRLAAYQGAVNKLAGSTYMGGRTDVVNAILTSASPTSLIDKMSIQQVMATEMTEQMQSFRRATREAQAIQLASARSAADAKAAVDAAAAVRADLQGKQSELKAEIAEAKVRYAMLPPAEQTALAPSAAVVAALGLINPIPTVGMGGLVPNARGLAAYIMATYPGVRSIGGVRSDPLPDHPSGRAIDIMIGSDMALGDAINADIQRQAARFGVSYTMWRVASHFDHVHITVS